MSTQAPVSETTSAAELALRLRTILGRMKRRLREHGTRADLTPSQIAVLLRLEKDGAATVSGLARAEGMRPQSMSSIVDSLEEAGLVCGIPDPNDGRKTLMSLSQKCVELIREVRATKLDRLTTIIAQKLSAEEQEQLSTSLALLDRLSED